MRNPIEAKAAQAWRIMGACLALLLCGVPLHAQDEPGAAAPRIVNASEIQRMLSSDYPDVLRPHGVNTSALARLFVASTGVVDSVQLQTSTGVYELDRLAREAARKVRFATPIEPAAIDLPFQFISEDNPSATVPAAPVPVDTTGLDAFYPDDLRARGMGAYVGLSLLVDGAGRVVEQTLIVPSCLDAANESAFALARGLTFAPAPEGRAFRRTYATVSFIRSAVGLTLRGDVMRRDSIADPLAASESEGATSPPVLRNRGQVERRLVSSYPPRLRDAGIGGSPTVHIWVDEDGNAPFVMIATGSGECALDRAALEVGSVMRFSPAQSNGEKVAVWVEIPIIFSARD